MVDILKRVQGQAVDPSDVLRQLGEGLRDDATMALCCGASVVSTKFTLTVADARAVADEIARLQRVAVPAVSERDALDALDVECAGVPLSSFISGYALAALIVLALPVTLAVLGVLQ